MPEPLLYQYLWQYFKGYAKVLIPMEVNHGKQ